MTECGNQIRSLRQKQGLTQAELAEALHVRYQTVSKWERGTTLPDTAMLCTLADFFRVSLDTLFGRVPTCCTGAVPEEDAAFLLKTYAQMYDPEAGPWNLSVANRYLEYRFADFFEKHFEITDGMDLCNIGIGAGEWDRYLSYKLRGGTLTSIDRLEIVCRQLEKRLICEGNPNPVQVICADVMELDLKGRFDIVTMVGSTVQESGMGIKLLEQAMTFTKPGGAIYYQTLEEREDPDATIAAAHRQNMKLTAYLADDSYGISCHYYKFQT